MTIAEVVAILLGSALGSAGGCLLVFFAWPALRMRRKTRAIHTGKLTPQARETLKRSWQEAQGGENAHRQVLNGLISRNEARERLNRLKWKA